jgi:hypothetical protein
MHTRPLACGKDAYVRTAFTKCADQVFHRNTLIMEDLSQTRGSKAATTERAVATFDWQPFDSAQRKQSIRPRRLELA